jgi:hypothetical protein
MKRAIVFLTLVGCLAVSSTASATMVHQEWHTRVDMSRQAIINFLVDLANPVPPPDYEVSWTAGEFAATHDVYLGTVFADVNDASRADPRDVLASQGQTATTYQPAAPLEYGQTYYWRVDEVNAPPSTHHLQRRCLVLHRRAVRLSHHEHHGHRLQCEGRQRAAEHRQRLRTRSPGPAFHRRQHMWLSTGTLPNWIQYEFDQVYKLHELWVWNYNHSFEPFLGWGAKEVKIEYSVDGETWTELEDVPSSPRPRRSHLHAQHDRSLSAACSPRFVKLTIQSNWGTLTQTGLSEVRFFHVPVQAREPVPADGATGVAIDTELGWRPGREAESHKVYFAPMPTR